MKRFDWRILIVSVTIFLIPPLCIPARGVLTEDITSYVYGFPFSWFTVYFESRGGKAFLVQALMEQHEGISISIVSAILNLAIIYIVINAIITVFWKKHRQKTPPKDPPQTLPKDENQETVSAGQSHGSDVQ